jgi:hypothetical protein
MKHGVDERGLAMVDVGYDGDVADVLDVFGCVHPSMFARWWLLILISMAAFAADGGEGRIVGQVVDEAGAWLSGASVIVTPDGGGPPLFRTKAGPGGNFALEHVKPGAYVVRISSPGFRVERVHTTVSAGTAADLKSVALKIGNCDLPGVICDCFGVEGYDDTILARGHLFIKKGCGADLDAGKVICEKEAKADLLFGPGDGAGLYLRPLNGALITPLDTQTYGDKPVRIDGLGPGSDFWVRAASGHSYSHVILTADVDPDSAELDLWYVSRPR